MEPGGRMSHLQELSSNPYPGTKSIFLTLTYIYLRFIIMYSSYILLAHSRGLPAIGLPVNFFYALLPFPILATLPDVIMLPLLGERSSL